MKRIHQDALLFTIFLTAILFSIAAGQVSQYVVDVKVPPATQQTPLSVSVEMTQNVQILRVLLDYRQFGETEYKELEMLLAGRVAVATVPANAVMPPFVEYYIKFQLADNSMATYPSENPEVNPIKIAVPGS